MFDWNNLPRPEVVHYWERQQGRVNFYINELKVYNDVFEIQLETEKERFTNSIAIINENESELNAEEIVDSFPNIFRGAFLIQILALLENQLKEVCNLIETYNYQKFSISDLKGSDLEKAKTVFENVCLALII